MKLHSYSPVFRPQPQVYPGLSGSELIHGERYDNWVVNDHCHIQDADGIWHMFGITHPLTTAKNIHEGELQLFHAAADSPLGPYRDLGTILPPSERPGERPEIHSPAVVRKDGVYYMIYGPEKFRMAKSEDLTNWKPLGPVIEEIREDARDPQILYCGGTYYLSYCMGAEVFCRTSADLFSWSGRKRLLRLPEGLCPESPFLHFRDGKFYLFVCLWDGQWDNETVSQAYQSVTQVYAAPELRQFRPDDLEAVVAAHAPELIEYDGRCRLSSAEYPERGISLAQLDF